MAIKLDLGSLKLTVPVKVSVERYDSLKNTATMTHGGMSFEFKVVESADTINEVIGKRCLLGIDGQLELQVMKETTETPTVSNKSGCCKGQTLRSLC